jgi:integrase
MQRIPPLSEDYFKTYKVAIQRVNHIAVNDMQWQPVSRQPRNYADSCFSGVVNDYEDYLKSDGKTTKDIRARLHVVARFLQRLAGSGMTCMHELTSQAIYYGFLAEQNKDQFRKSVRSFLQYAYRSNLIHADLSGIVPSLSRHKPAPSIYTPEEIETILASIDRSSNTGKRNYAIVLIAARYGLRSCDLANLRFENVLFDSGVIRLLQMKTKQAISFPLLPEVRDALCDYLENGRPESESERIFQKATSPRTGDLNPYTIYIIISRIIEKSPIAPNGRKRGAHALRSSLATALLNEGNDYSVVRKALGHKAPNSAKAYVKLETEKLRAYALPVPDASGGFARFLAGLAVAT